MNKKNQELKENLTGSNEKIIKIIYLFNKIQKDSFFKSQENLGKIFVPAIGNVDSKVILIGEAPGKDEEKQRMPFVGKAGKNLNEVLKKVSFKREEIYITNVVKFRPFDNKGRNRKPTSLESQKGLVYLKKELDIIKPKVIICLGLTAVNALLSEKLSMKESINKIFNFEGYNLIATYHPSPFNFNRKDLKEKIIKSFERIRSLI